MVVVLPAPLRPSRVTTSPRRTSNSMPCSTWDSPYQAFRPLTTSSAVPMVPAGAMAASCMAGPHIGFDDFGILRHRLVIAFGKDLAAAQHGDGVRQLGHQIGRASGRERVCQYV